MNPRDQDRQPHPIDSTLTDYDAARLQAIEGIESEESTAPTANPTPATSTPPPVVTAEPAPTPVPTPSQAAAPYAVPDHPQAPVSTTTVQPIVSEKKSTKFFLILFIVIIGLAAGASGYFVWQAMQP